MESSPMDYSAKNLSIGTFAKVAGVNVETVRFYQRKGLLPEPERPYGSINRYGEADLKRLNFIRTSQRLGFSLTEIGELLRLDDGAHCEEVSQLAERKLRDVREKLAGLKRMEATLAELVDACHAQTGEISCPLIKTLHEDVDRVKSVLP